MDPRDLARIDLNLLFSLQVLLDECHVTKAAKRLHITQPAMSKTLSRLRSLFDDDLLTRSSDGMQPTPLAIRLIPELRAILDDIGNLLAPQTFDPKSFNGEVTLALSEYIGVALLPPLIARLTREAPLLQVRAVTRVENQLQELALGNLDFAIQMQQNRYGDDYRCLPLGGSPPAIIVGDGHPLCEGPITLERLAAYPLIRLYVSDREQLALTQSGEALLPLHNHPMGTLEISHLLTALEVLRSTHYFMPAPAYILQNSAATVGIAALPVPEGHQQPIEYTLIAHQRTQRSPLHNWLWRQISATIADLKIGQAQKIRQRVTAGRTET